MKKLRISLCKSKGNPFQLLPMRPEMIALLNNISRFWKINVSCSFKVSILRLYINYPIFESSMTGKWEFRENKYDRQFLVGLLHELFKGTWSTYNVINFPLIKRSEIRKIIKSSILHHKTRGSPEPESLK